MRQFLRQTITHRRFRTLQDDRTQTFCDHVLKVFRQDFNATAEFLRIRFHIHGTAKTRDKPCDRVLGQMRNLAHRLKLYFGGNLTIERLDLVPQRAQAERLAYEYVRKCDFRRTRAGFVHARFHESRPHAVDERVRHHRCDDLAFQTVAVHFRAEFFPENVGEILHQPIFHIRAVWDIRRQ